MGKPISQVKRFTEEPKWEDQCQWIEFTDNKLIMLRLVGDTEVLLRHWIRTTSGKMFPQWCPKFDSYEESLTDAVCPAHDDFEDRGQKMIVGNAIVRSLQDRGDVDPYRAFMLPHAVLDDLLVIAKMIDCDPGHPEGGVDLAFVYNPKAAGNKKWSVQRGNATPLTKAELAYNYYDMSSICPDFQDQQVVREYGRRMRESMARQKYYVTQEHEVPEVCRDPFKYFRGDINGKPWHAFQELVDYRNESDGNKYSVRKEDDGVEREIEKPRRIVEQRRAPAREPARKAEPAVDMNDTSEFTLDDRREAAAKAEPKAEPKVKEAEPKKAEPGKEADDDVYRHPDDSIGTKRDAELGIVPECYTEFSGEPKCAQCPVRQPCIANMSEDL